MRIGIFCNTFGRSGGMETYALNIVQACLELGHKPVVFCKKADRSLSFASQCEVHEYSLKLLPNKLYFYLFHRWLTQITNAVPVDFSIGCCLGGYPEVMACGGTRIGYLQAMHKPVMPWDRLIIDIEQAAYDKAKIVIAHADKMRKELEQLYKINSSKISVIYPPLQIPHECIVNNKNKIREKYNLPQNKTIFLFPSQSHKRKGFDLLCKHFEKRETEDILVVAGKPIPHSCKKIKYLGFCENMSEVYQLSDYTILASLYEPLALVAIESILNGTPVVMADGMGCHEVIDPTVIRGFDPYNYSRELP